MKKKNILFVDEGLAFGGSFIVAARLASHLDQDRYDSVIITATPLIDIAHHASEGVKLVYLRKWLTYKHRGIFQGKLSALKSGSSVEKFLSKLAIYAYSAVELLANFPYLMGICYQIIKHKIDIVHGNNAVEAIIAGRLLGKKIVWHIHGDGAYSKGQLTRYFNDVDTFISISHFSTGNAINSGIPAEKIITIHNPTGTALGAIDQSIKLAMQATYNIPLGVPVVGIFGRLINWKGQLEFLKAAEYVLKTDAKVHFLVVGGDGENFGSYTQTLHNFVAKHGLTQNVSFTGYVKNTNEHYQLCDIVVHASIEPEPFGLVIIEAMQNGAAVIVADTGAAPELVVQGETGIIANPKDTQALADAILFLVANEQQREEYAKAARDYVEVNMSPAYYAQQVSSVYSNFKC